MNKKPKTSKRALQKKSDRDMPDDPKELARAIFRVATGISRNLINQRHEIDYQVFFKIPLTKIIKLNFGIIVK